MQTVFHVTALRLHTEQQHQLHNLERSVAVLNELRNKLQIIKDTNKHVRQDLIDTQFG